MSDIGRPQATGGLGSQEAADQAEIAAREFRAMPGGARGDGGMGDLMENNPPAAAPPRERDPGGRSSGPAAATAVGDKRDPGAREVKLEGKMDLDHAFAE